MATPVATANDSAGKAAEVVEPDEVADDLHRESMSAVAGCGYSSGESARYPLNLTIPEEAFRLRSRYLVWLKVAPEYEALRSDPRYQELIARIGLS